jgi:predicted TIM-barrel fold metal-dependent hydrolase
MRFLFSILILITTFLVCSSQEGKHYIDDSGSGKRIHEYIDTLEIVDTHEHFFNPELLRATNFLDFSLLLQQNSYDGFLAAGMPAELMKKLYIEPTPVSEKWKIIEPYWNNSYNTIANRILLSSVRELYNIHDLNGSTVEALSEKIKSAYSGDWFDHVLKDLCRFRYVIVDGDNLGKRDDYIRYVKRFSPWLTLNTKFRIDSIAVMQVEPIYTLEDYVKSMTSVFEDALKRGMVAVKINTAYKRSLYFEKVPVETARKVFRTIINGNEDLVLPAKDAKPLQDYMMFRLLDMARRYKIPVAFHTGIQAGLGNTLEYSDPTLLINLFREYPDVNFVLFHGSYPFGGEVATIVRNYPNVYIDMNWTWSISPTYAGHYLNQWLEAVPVSKIMAFGGDQRCVENTYGNLMVAKKIIGDVLTAKVESGYFTEKEACSIARMILLENPKAFYKLR